MRYCARQFTASELQAIRSLLNVDPPLSRYRLSREVCERLNWRRADGRLKDMSCRVALARMQADGLLTLPAPKKLKPVAFKSCPKIEHLVSAPTRIPAVDLTQLSIELIDNKRDSLLWNAYIQRHHYL